MSELAILDTTTALRDRIAGAVGGPVHVGAPIRTEIGSARVSLFLFHCDVNAALRNRQRFERPPPLEPATARARPVDSLAMDLRFLVTVFRDPDPTVATPNELTRLGQIIQALHAAPTLSGPGMGGQVVRVSPEPYPMEELSRVFGLLGQDIYRTSIVYLATPVHIESGLSVGGRPVTERRQRSAHLVERQEAAP